MKDMKGMKRTLTSLPQKAQAIQENRYWLSVSRENYELRDRHRGP
jgi:hypothetical protein